MVDIAAIFHWPLSELRELDLVELTHWHELAIEWWKMELKLRARMSGMKG